MLSVLKNGVYFVDQTAIQFDFSLDFDDFKKYVLLFVNETDPAKKSLYKDLACQSQGKLCCLNQLFDLNLHENKEYKDLIFALSSGFLKNWDQDQGDQEDQEDQVPEDQVPEDQEDQNHKFHVTCLFEYLMKVMEYSYSDADDLCNRFIYGSLYDDSERMIVEAYHIYMGRFSNRKK